MNSRKNSSSLMVLYIRGKSRTTKDTDLESKYGQMEPDMRDYGAITLLQAEASSSTLTVMFMMVRYIHFC